LAEKNKFALEEGEIVNVICISAGENLENVVFDLTENIENEINFKFEQEKFINSLKHGDKYLGKIKNVQGFGVFVSFGLTEGLLHITQIMGETIELSKLSRKEFFKTLEQLFKKGQEIEIIFDYYNDNGISLIWDKNIELNKNLYDEIYNKYKTLQKK
jgi:ribosomal protein S1